MSRCFPFPPPGYEKKARPDENLLAKEKHREKKHKKEKKDREKRDKKDNDRSEEKHREKRNRKEKSKDKNEKRKDKDKGGKKKSSDEKNTTLPPPPPSLPPPPPENLADDTTEFKFLFELGKRNNREDDERATESQMVQKISLTSQRRAELPNYIVESNHASAETNKFVIERREKNNEKNQNQSYTKDIEIDTSVKRSNYSVNAVNLVGAEKQQMEEKEKSTSSKRKRKHSSGESRSDKHKDKDREKKSSSKSRKREKKEKEERTKEKKPDKDQEQIKLKETSKISDGVRNIKPLSEILGKRKEPEVNGFLHENDVRPNKLPRPATSSSNQITENGGSKAEPSRLPNSLTPPERKGVIVNNLKTNGSNLLPNPQITADNGKKTEQSVHKISPSHSNSDNKTQLQALVSNPVLENGRKLEPSQWKTGIGVIQKTDKKIQNGVNGLTLSEPVVQEPVFKPPPPPVKKPPHPDLKYLSQILTVPSVECLDFDDQEWLFANKDSQISNKIRTKSEPISVWSEAIRMESDDITALPYVIRY